MAADQDFFAAFIENTDDINVLKATAQQLRLKNYEVISGGIKEAIDLYGSKKSPLYLIIDISKSELPITDVAHLLEVCSPNVSIITIGVKNEVSLYRDLSKLGVYDYLLSPLFSEILEQTLHRMLAGKNKVEEPRVKVGKVITCIGSRGGVGTTFIASNLAAMLSTEKLRRVVLVDLDLYFGTLALNFDIKPNPGFREALENPGRIDQVLIDRILTPINERLFMLCSEEPFQEKVKYKIEALEGLLDSLAKQFHYIIVDAPHYIDNVVNALITKTNLFVLITEPSVAGLRDTARLMSFFRTQGSANRSILVMNKYGQFGKSELKVDDFEDVLTSKIHHKILYNNVIPMEFLNQGKVMTNENNVIADPIREIMFDILGIRPTVEPTGWFKKLF